MTRALLLCLCVLFAVALAQDECVWDKVIEQSVLWELFTLVGVQLAVNTKIGAPRLAVVSLTQRAAAVGITLPGITANATGQVSEIITVLDGNYFVVASADIGLFLVLLDSSGRAEVISNFSAPAVCARTRLVTDIDREYIYFAANDTVYVMTVTTQALVLLSSIQTSPDIGYEMNSVALRADGQVLYIGSSHQSSFVKSFNIAYYDISQPSSISYAGFATTQCFADTMAVSGQYLYTANTTAVCIFDYNNNFWMPGQIPLYAYYLSTSTFDPWIYISENTTTNSMILALFDQAQGGWNVNITKFSAPLLHPSCVAVKHSTMDPNEVFLACDNVLMSVQYVCPHPSTSVAVTTGSSTTSVTTSAATTGNSISSAAITTVTLQATFTTAQESSSSGHHSHAGRTVGIVFGSLILVALIALGIAYVRYYWLKHHDGTERVPLL